MQRFTLEQLATLLALVSEGSFETAAARLHVTPSAVSQRVKAMEQTCGRVLVQRTTPIRLTDAGDVLLRYARQVELLEADTVRELQEGRSDGDALLIPLAVNADSLATWFLDALAGLGDRLGVAFDLHREDQEHTTKLLRAGTVMAAVTSTREPVQGCVTEALGNMRYRAVATPEFVTRWLPAGPGLSGLPQAPVVAFERNDDLQEAFLRDHAGGGSSGPTHYIPTSNDFVRAILLGFGWGMLPEQQCAEEIVDGRLVDLAPTLAVDVPLYWQRWNLSSPLLDAVSMAVRDEAHATLRSF
ncbi:chromosome replication initiation inhibitor protein [Cryobacterium sp. MLB-32]|uniref:LysR family transcriptional regulator ArgP n=1 Tax=Cryobacterium sp. MLB-32 TaxID=1529318 RepID=UPI0004E61C0D|nr:LysR family transcriptional regulator ArgP [Cryobacterium sp. MLB-32]KFF60432.1 chromosome replication initiation inhibitor protein [Cryobacterium sp. MLB-32]